ncbi:MAG: hypothetical protein ABJM06_07625 [Gilvibacter sp.]
MKLLLVVAVLFLATYSSQAQQDEAFVDNAISEFIESQPTQVRSSMYSVKRFCNGSVKMFMMADGSRCATTGDYIEAYLIYKNEAAVFIKKFDNCGAYDAIQLEDAKVYKMFVTDAGSLVKEVVKPYKTAQENTQPLSRTKVYRCHRSFTYYIGEESTIVSYPLYDLSNESLQPNVNYEFNNNLGTVKLDKILDSIIVPLEENKSFKRS